MSLQFQISLLFFITFTIYVFFSIYILALNAKVMQNRIFFILCLSLSVWAFSFSIANTAPDYETALFWRRIASLGWGTAYSLLLHFVLLLTQRHRILKNKWLYVLLYLPAVINVFIYGLYNKVARGQYNLVKSVAGWIHIPANNSLDWYFNLYYMGFTIVGLGILLYWGRKTSEHKIKKQTSLLITSVIIAFIVGTITDIIANRYLLGAVPQIAVVIMLIPVTGIFYAIRCYGLMAPEVKRIAPENDKIINKITRVRLYLNVTIGYIFGSILNFLTKYFFHKDSLGSTLLFSGCLLLFGLLVQLVRQLKIKEEQQNAITIFIMMISVPIITLRFVEYASISVWAISFLLVILSVVFSYKRMIIWLSIVLLLTQIVVWLIAPSAIVQVDGSDHLIRIGILGLTLWLARFVNQIYIKRLEENENQIKFQKMISQISADFVNASITNIDDKIDGMLEQIGEYSQVDSAYLFVFSKDLENSACTHKWHNNAVETLDIYNNMSMTVSSCLKEQILSNTMVYIPNVSEMSCEDEVGKKLLKMQLVQSQISIPVTNNDRVLGFLRLDAIKNVKTWSQDQRELLQIIANLLADALMKVEAEKEINYMAYYDSLTGLANRILFKNRLEKAISLASRSEKFIVVMFIDLDSFKGVNDTMGHKSGDALLKQVAQNLSSRVRQYDTVSRFGGDEFLVMIPQIAQAEDIKSVADNIMKTFNQPVTINGQEFFITASAGISVYPLDGEDADSLIKNADLAMYISKDGGKNKYTLCSQVMKEDIMKKMQLTNSLYRAQERNELVLYYQPQVDIATNKIVGIEALIRWKHPELGMISPSVFIPIAEQTGLINSIGQWVLKTACQQSKLWQDQGLKPIRIAVNLSVEQFRSSNLVSIVKSTLEETGLQPEFLELEITESIAIEESDYIIRILNDLKLLGLTIAIDDFGTEYSSLSRLKELPIDRLKIAMQFVQGISINTKDEAIVEVLIHLARSLGLKVIAEGVETELQLSFLERGECDEIQGYYYYKPMSKEDMETVLSNNL